MWHHPLHHLVARDAIPPGARIVIMRQTGMMKTLAFTGKRSGTRVMLLRSAP